MAASYTTKIGGATRAWKTSKGLKFVQVEYTCGDVSVDYSSGFTLTPALMGLTRLFAVWDVSVRSSGGTTRGLRGMLDPTTGKLRLLEASTNSIDDGEADTDFADADVIRFMACGV